MYAALKCSLTNPPPTEIEMVFNKATQPRVALVFFVLFSQMFPSELNSSERYRRFNSDGKCEKGQRRRIANKREGKREILIYSKLQQKARMEC